MKHPISKQIFRYGALPAALCSLALFARLNAAEGRVRIIQTNHAGDNVHIIDPATNKVVEIISGIGESPHGVAVAPDGSAYYFSSEADETLDVVDGKTLKLKKKIALTGLPNNLAMSNDGRRVYVGILQPPGGVDVIDTASLAVVKTIPTVGGIHNLYVTPDGKYVVAGSNEKNNIIVIDTKTEKPEWVLYLDGAVRPFTFETNPDGSTKRIFLQVGAFHGFYVVDFEKRRQVARVALPEVPPTARYFDPGIPSHGMGVAPNGRTLWLTSRLNRHAYAYSLPDLKPIGGVPIGATPLWLTFTPDSKFVYVANSGDNDVSVIDIGGMKAVTRIPVGQYPERNIAVTLPPLS
jgi:YVTN family beta-propeller protein